MKYELLIYAGSQVLSALDVDGERIQYISMLGNTEHSADDVNGFYEQLLDYYNVDNLSEIDTDIRIINGDMSQNNILFFLEKLKKIKTFSIWRIEELLPIVLINNNMIDKGKCVKVRVYDRCYAVSTDEKFNVTASVADSADNELHLEDFTLFNNYNGVNFKQDTELIENLMDKIRNLEEENRKYQYAVEELENSKSVLESEKTSLQQELSKYIIEENYSVGNVIEFGIYEGEPVKWRIIKHNNNSIYVISEKILCKKSFAYSSLNNWEKSDLRKWLNSEFYTNTFNEDEKIKILNTYNDKITLLSKEEYLALLSNEIAKGKGEYWWLRSPDPSYKSDYYVHIVHASGAIVSEFAYDSCGVRPALHLLLD